MELFKNTIFINLEHRQDRHNHVIKQLESLNINGTRLNAVKLKNGALGCTISHIKCLEKAKQRLRDQGVMEQDMEEAQYDENDAHSSLPGVRKTTEQEHSRYDAAAHEIRKWMRKRGWNTNKEFKSALKYIMDNLDDKHDDSLTHKVKEAAKICEKHHATMVEAGLDMNLLSKAQGAMQGANTDPESERNRGKKYG